MPNPTPHSRPVRLHNRTIRRFAATVTAAIAALATLAATGGPLAPPAAAGSGSASSGSAGSGSAGSGSAGSGSGSDAGRPIVGSSGPAASPAGSTVLTLVTGDVVRLTAAPSSPKTQPGKGSPPSVQVVPANGHPSGFQTRSYRGHLYVYPAAAAEALAAGAVDDELFDVTGLIEQGYARSPRAGTNPSSTPSSSPALPVITEFRTAASYTARQRSRASTPGARLHRELPSIHARALAVDTTDTADTASFWDAATRDLGIGSGAGRTDEARATSPVRKLWLDARMTSTLHESVAQVRAPEAWTAGYDGTGATVAVLDSGADADHPDLSGQISASKDFTDSSNGTDDALGHGTHVASTIAGTGKASDGREKGVAPGAKLLVGKVLNNYGGGTESAVIAGMEWAVDQGADVVSMSLGSQEPTDCTDPVSSSVRALAAKDTALFVVAAGNLGTAESVTSPGCVPAVLTVGAVDGKDATASFSSRGSTIGAHTPKPEIAAPGVGILAAATHGRGLYAYQSMSGTSMATPHVAGAAAILAEEHPDWTASQVKRALVSAADSDVSGRVTEVGAGRLDVRAATLASALGPDAVNGGTYRWPQDPSDATTIPIRYDNPSGRAVTLQLAVAELEANDGSRAPSGVARLRTKRLVVPAGGSASADLALDPDTHLAAAQYGDLGGRVVATASDGTRISTPFSLYVEPPTVTVRVKVLDRAGQAAGGPSTLDLVSLDIAAGERRYVQGSDQVFRVRPGAYTLNAFVSTPDPGVTYGDAWGGKLEESLTYLGAPQVEVTRDTTLVLDARAAHELRVPSPSAGRPLEVQSASIGYGRTWDRWILEGSASASSTTRHLYAGSAGGAARPRTGTYALDVLQRAYAPMLTMRLSGANGFAVPTTPPTRRGFGKQEVALLDGTGRAPLVDGKAGAPADLANARGAVVLVHAETTAELGAAAKAASDAGAVAVLGYRTAGGLGRWRPAGGAPLPVLTVDTKTAKALLARVSATPTASAALPEVTWTGTIDSPYAYHLAAEYPAPPTHPVDQRVGDQDLAHVTGQWHSLGASGHFFDWAQWRPSWPGATLIGVGDDDWVATPGTRDEYFTPGHWKRVVDTSFPYGDELVDPLRSYARGEHTTQDWFGGIVRPVAPIADDGTVQLQAERQGNQIGFSIGSYWGDRDPRHWSPGAFFGTVGTSELRREGVSLGRYGTPYGVWDVPADDSAYELRVTTAKIGAYHPMFLRSVQTETVFAFGSHEDPAIYSQGIPVMWPGYDLPADGANNVAAGPTRIGFSLSGHAEYQPGAIVGGTFAISYDHGKSWEPDVPVTRDGSTWAARVDHSGHPGAQVSTRVRLRDANGNAVTQTLVDAYGVR